MDHRAMREEILAYKRERILEEAVKLFYERGFTGTTLDDIAAELGVTKPFIYTHFRSKTDLLAALCKPTIELSLEAVARRGEVARFADRAAASRDRGFHPGGAVAPGQHRNLLPRGEEPGARCAGGDQCAAQEVRPRAVQPAHRGRRGRRVRHRRREPCRAGNRRHDLLGLHLAPSGGAARARRHVPSAWPISRCRWSGVRSKVSA